MPEIVRGERQISWPSASRRRYSYTVKLDNGKHLPVELTSIGPQAIMQTGCNSASRAELVLRAATDARANDATAIRIQLTPSRPPTISYVNGG